MGPEGAGRKSFALPPVALDRSSSVPLYRQLHRQIAEAIRSGRLPAGARVPSTRLLAKVLAVSRNTVTQAYEELAADGLLESRERSQMCVKSSRLGRGVQLQALRSILRAAHFPARTQAFEDPDGNCTYLTLR